MSDSAGYVYDEKGIDLAVVKQIKEVERGRIKAYAERVPGAVYTEGCKGIWTIPCDVALPCATQNELDLAGCRGAGGPWRHGSVRGRQHAHHPRCR